MTALKLHSSNTLDIYSALTDTNMELPYIELGIGAVFPSPKLDFIDVTIDLNKHLVKNPPSTFYGRVKGQSMKNEGINDGDLLVIDKSLESRNGDIAVCYIDGEYTVKKIKIDNGECWLMSANKNYQPIKMNPETDFIIWGILTHVIKAF